MNCFDSALSLQCCFQWPCRHARIAFGFASGETLLLLELSLAPNTVRELRGFFQRDRSWTPRYSTVGASRTGAGISFRDRICRGVSTRANGPILNNTGVSPVFFCSGKMPELRPLRRLARGDATALACAWSIIIDADRRPCRAFDHSGCCERAENHKKSLRIRRFHPLRPLSQKRENPLVLK
jgi:hypothetical protein